MTNGYISYVFMANVSSNEVMPTFTIGPAYHPLSSFSISSNSLIANATFTEHNLTGYQYYDFSPMYDGNPVWFLVNGQVGDRLSVLLDGNVSLTVQLEVGIGSNYYGANGAIGRSREIQELYLCCQARSEGTSGIL